MRRGGRRVALAGAMVVALTASTMAGAAGAEPEYGALTVTPEIASAGSMVAVTSTVRCPAAPDGLELDEVQAGIVTDGQSAFGSDRPDPDRSWRVTFALPGGLRNGGYPVLAVCLAGDDEEQAWWPYYFYIGRVIVGSGSGVVDPVMRLAGADRIGTAIAVSQDTVTNDEGYAGAVLARADSFADSLVGSALAQAVGGPLLLTPGDNLSPLVEGELRRIAGDGGQVFVLGGQAAIGPNVVDRLVTLGFDVTRFAGANRFETAVKVAEEIGTESNTVLLADGHNFVDGLLAGAAAAYAGEKVFGPYGYPAGVLLTDGSSMPAETRAYLEAHPGVTQVAIGAAASAAAPGAVPIVGADAAEASVKVAERFFPDPWCVGITNSTVFADGLAGGAHAPHFGGPLLFTDGATLSPVVKTYLEAHTQVPIGFVYGGSAVIEDAVLNEVMGAIT